MNRKIQQTHLERLAMVYLRQSTPHQVESNRESTQRQYALADRAAQLGWDNSQIQILDGDLGKSGQTLAGRNDFHRLMAAVGLGEVGAVLALEASRFSRSQADWHKLIDICAHPAYISFEQFKENEQQLMQNHGAIICDGRQGSAREGAALLQGLVICGKCGRRMSPRYHGRGGKRTTYQCDQLRKQDGVHGICWSVPGVAIDEAVATHLLEAITESNLDMSFAVLQELERSAQESEHQWQLRLERVRYEAERAARQFDAVEPENRLVVRTLERRWNEKLQQLAELEQAYAEARQVQRLELSTAQRQQILRLAKDIPAIWRSPTTTPQERKEILGLLVKQVAITPVENPTRQTCIAILWHTGATSELLTDRPSIQQKLGTPEQVIQTVRELATGRTDVEIAQQLNQSGLLSGKGRSFTASAVAWIRWKFKIGKPGSDPGFAGSVGIRSDGSYSTSALADKLGVGIHTIHYWRKKGVVEAFQETPSGPWWHRVTPEVLQMLRDNIRRVPVKSE